MADVRVLPQSTAGVHLMRLRDETTPPENFRRHARMIGSLLAAAAIEDVPLTTTDVATPMGPATAEVPAPPIVAVPVLRAGLGLLPGVEELLPNAVIGMVGLARDPDTHQPAEYFRKVPELDGAWVLLLEPMLATGGSAAAAVDGMRQAGAARVVVLSVVGTQQAVDLIVDRSPGVRIVTAAIDPQLDDNAYIVPGLGDFGDRLFGTHH